jgi:hypothetical protein
MNLELPVSPMMRRGMKFAWDRASVRTTDADGRT